MHYAYVLESEAEPGRHYIGSTDDVGRRLSEHNAGKSAHTAKYRPWQVKSYFAFRERATAERFEAYLKSGSGREFARRHFE